MNTMELTFRQLEIFVTTARLEHVTGAGEALGLTQPAVSLALAEIEKQCHGPLFRRVGRKVMLNDRGRLLLPEAEAVLGRLRLLYERMESRQGDPAGMLRLGASTTIGNYLLPAIIGAFTRRRPRAQIELMVGNTHQVEEGVESGHLDLGFIEGPGHRPGLLLTPWRDDELVIIVAPRHPWSRRAAVKKGELGKAAWLGRERGSGTREVFERAMAEAGLRPRMKLELGHTEAIKQATVANLGVACLSRLAVAGDIEAGRLVEVATELDLTRSLSLVSRPESDRTPLLEEFSAFLTGKHTR